MRMCPTDLQALEPLNRNDEHERMTGSAWDRLRKLPGMEPKNPLRKLPGGAQNRLRKLPGRRQNPAAYAAGSPVPLR